MTSATKKLPEVATCCHCHQHKPLHQLNGFDPLTGDTSQAYCKHLTQCDSQFAQQQLKMIAALSLA